MNGAATPGDADRLTVRLALLIVGGAAYLLIVVVAVVVFVQRPVDLAILTAILPMIGTAIGYVAGTLGKVTGHGVGLQSAPLTVVPSGPDQVTVTADAAAGTVAVETGPAAEATPTRRRA